MISKSTDRQNFFIDVIYSITEFKRELFVLSVKVLSP